MMMVVTYDVNTASAGGEKRLRKVARICEKYGIRVQNSVFEIMLDASQFVVLKDSLEKVIDLENDSVRFYRMGNTWEQKVETMGKIPLIQTGKALIL